MIFLERPDGRGDDAPQFEDGLVIDKLLKQKVRDRLRSY